MNTPIISYFICTNPRSGSWLLSEGLASTGLAGNPREWFQEEEQRDQSARWGIEYPAEGNYASYLAKIHEEGTTDNGLFGAKVMYYQFVELATKIAHLKSNQKVPLAQSLTALFPGLKYIWLRRRDTARQAISYHRACQTDVWWQIEGELNPQRPGTTGEPTFDPDAIARLEREIVQNDLSWQHYFNDNQIKPLTLYYEDIVADYAGAVANVLTWLGVAGADTVSVAEPRLKKQADAQTEEWLARYLACEQSGHRARRSSIMRNRMPLAASGTATPQATRSGADVPHVADAAHRLEISIIQVAGDEMFKGHRPEGTGWDWSWATPQRDWMNETQSKFAYRCLPLTIANQTGWWVNNPVGFTAVWHGHSDRGKIEFQFDSEPDLWTSWINNQFGHGIITWNTPFLFRTKPIGSRLLICGPANYFKHAVQPLMAIVESDWATMSFTMNWKITSADTPIRFDKGEPLFQVIPLSTNLCANLESAAVTYMKLTDDPVLAEEYAQWNESRHGFHEEKASGNVKPDDWQKDYFKGQNSFGRDVAPAHTTKVTAPSINFVSPRP